eukprot:SAG11_NODE_8760_length_979_cov_1.063636_1_plen_61_part_10
MRAQWVDAIARSAAEAKSSTAIMVTVPPMSQPGMSIRVQFPAQGQTPTREAQVTLPPGIKA